MFRLKSVYIKEYKNIHEQTFDFSTNTGYIALIGLNGSGKSNLLEAISIIFDDLYGIARVSDIREYEIKYEIDGVLYTYSTVDEHRNSNPLAKPSSVIACYSGEDLRLWNMAYMPYYMSFFYSALHGGDYVPQNIYVNKYCWKIALISLLFSLNRETQQFVHDTLQINPDNITIQFKYNEIQNPQPHDAYNWLDRVKQTYRTNKIPLADLRDFGLGNLKHTELTEDKLIFFYLYLLYIPSKSPRQPIDKLISNISIELGGYEFDSLSEGEKKMILIGCITQVLGDENSLVLLDEPDAHVHIENKKKILDTIEQYKGQTILTTHSPVMSNLVGDANNIKLMKDGQFTNTSKLEQLKRLSGNELQYFEGAFVLSHKNILVTEGIYDIRYLRKAIEIFAQRDNKYKKLKEIGMLYAGSASEADIIYNELLNSNMDNLDKVVFLFDYDKGGLDGWKKVNPIVSTEPKVDAIFYQHDYSITLNTATDKVDQQDSIIVEDMFGEAAYSSLFVNPAIMTATHKYFRCRQKITDKIKEYLQKNYDTIDEHDYDKYEPLLEKLLALYNF